MGKDHKVGESKRRKVDVRNAQVVKRGGYTQTLEAITAGGFCPFCEEHLFKHHQRPLLFKTEHWLVTENAWPYKGLRHHFLFIVRKHLERTENLSPAMWTDLQRSYQIFVKRYRLKGATLMVRSGDTRITGATVNHLHAQVIVGSPRTKMTKPIKALVGFEK